MKFYVLNNYKPDEDNQHNTEVNKQNDSTNDIDNTLGTPPLSQASVSRINRDNYDDSTKPKKFRSISEVYNEIEEVMLDEELYIMGIDEPVNNKQAEKDCKSK